MKGWSPINGTLRQHVHEYREDGAVRAPRFGYLPEDASRIIELLKTQKSVFALPVELLGLFLNSMDLVHLAKTLPGGSCQVIPEIRDERQMRALTGVPAEKF